MKKIPDTKARMVLWGRMCPILLRMNPMNMKKRLTNGKGVAERIISVKGNQGTQNEKVLNENIMNRKIFSVLIIHIAF